MMACTLFSLPTIQSGTPKGFSGNSNGSVGDGIMYVVVVPPSELVTAAHLHPLLWVRRRRSDRVRKPRPSSVRRRPTGSTDGHQISYWLEAA